MYLILCRDFFDKVKVEFSSFLEDSKVDLHEIGTTFQNLLYLPFNRLRDYQLLLERMASIYPAVSISRTELLGSADEALQCIMFSHKINFHWSKVFRPYSFAKNVLHFW